MQQLGGPVTHEVMTICYHQRQNSLSWVISALRSFCQICPPGYVSWIVTFRDLEDCPCIHVPQWQGCWVVPQGTGVPFRCVLWLAGLGWKSCSPSHRGRPSLRSCSKRIYVSLLLGMRKWERVHSYSTGTAGIRKLMQSPSPILLVGLPAASGFKAGWTGSKQEDLERLVTCVLTSWSICSHTLFPAVITLEVRQ
jgi:hypothetical protein